MDRDLTVHRRPQVFRRPTCKLPLPFHSLTVGLRLPVPHQEPLCGQGADRAQLAWFCLLQAPAAEPWYLMKQQIQRGYVTKVMPSRNDNQDSSSGSTLMSTSTMSVPLGLTGIDHVSTVHETPTWKLEAMRGWAVNQKDFAIAAVDV